MDQIFFDARALPPAEAFDHWRVGVSDFDLTQGDPARPFDGTSTITSLGSIIVSESDLPPVRFLRTREKLADGHDMWSLSLVLSGGMHGDADGRPFDIAPGQIALFSHTRPADIITQRSRTIVLAIPAALLRKVNPARIHGALPEGSGTRLLAAYLQQLCGELPLLDPRAAVAASRALIALIEAAAIEGEPVDTAARRELRLRERLADHVRANFHASLTPEEVCRTFGVSKSALYRALKEEGGLRMLVRRLRLQEAHQKLLDPADSRTIQEIAHAVGYADNAQFSRHFHARYGYTAATLRAGASPPPAIPLASENIPRDFRAATDRMGRTSAA